ncbi:hypothetical protein ABE527_10615 [Brucella sp. TWI432]
MSFEYLDLESEFEVVDRGSTTFRSDHKIGLKAISATRFLIREYSWSGTGVDREPVPEVVSEEDKWGHPLQRIHGPLICEKRRRIMVVDLGRTLHIDERENVHFRHRMRDLNGTFEPFFELGPSKRVLNSIRMRITLPNWNNLRVSYTRTVGEDKKVVDSRNLQAHYNNNDRVSFQIEVSNAEQLKMGHKLSWIHNEN